MAKDSMDKELIEVETYFNNKTIALNKTITLLKKTIEEKIETISENEKTIKRLIMMKDKQKQNIEEITKELDQYKGKIKIKHAKLDSYLKTQVNPLLNTNLALPPSRKNIKRKSIAPQIAMKIDCDNKLDLLERKSVFYKIPEDKANNSNMLLPNKNEFLNKSTIIKESLNIASNIEETLQPNLLNLGEEKIKIIRAEKTEEMFAKYKEKPLQKLLSISFNRNDLMYKGNTIQDVFALNINPIIGPIFVDKSIVTNDKVLFWETVTEISYFLYTLVIDGEEIASEASKSERNLKLKNKKRTRTTRGSIRRQTFAKSKSSNDNIFMERIREFQYNADDNKGILSTVPEGEFEVSHTNLGSKDLDESNSRRADCEGEGDYCNKSNNKGSNDKNSDELEIPIKVPTNNYMAYKGMKSVNINDLESKISNMNYPNNLSTISQRSFVERRSSMIMPKSEFIN